MFSLAAFSSIESFRGNLNFLCLVLIAFGNARLLFPPTVVGEDEGDASGDDNPADHHRKMLS